jgi:hypothetical protein
MIGKHDPPVPAGYEWYIIFHLADVAVYTFVEEGAMKYSL